MFPATSKRSPKDDVTGFQNPATSFHRPSLFFCSGKHRMVAVLMLQELDGQVLDRDEMMGPRRKMEKAARKDVAGSPSTPL